MVVFIIAGKTYRQGKIAWTLFLSALGVIWMVSFWCSPFTHWLLSGLEKDYRAFDGVVGEINPSDTVCIMVLGAGHCCDPHLPPNQQLEAPELQRTVEAVRIYKSLVSHHSKVYFVGSGRQSPNASCPQALSVTRTTLLLGVSPSDTAMLIHTTDTETEAVSFDQRFGNAHPAILVTHAHHLTRATAWFGSHGIQTIPAPAHFYSRHDPADKRWWRKWYFDANNLNFWKHWVHEKLGMMELHWKRNQIDIPSPSSL